MIAIEARNLRKVYKGGVEALKDVTFDVERGEIFSFLGPNGAGKTTTVRILTCVTKPTSGTAMVEGLRVPEQCEDVRKIVSSVPQEFSGFSDLSVYDNVAYFASLYGTESKVDDVLDSLGLNQYRDVKFKKLSGGYKRRVAIASALVANPKVVFLDEPTIGLDPKARRSLWEVIKSLKDGGITVFLTTHYLDEAEKLSDRVAVLYQGRLVRTTTPDRLKEEFSKETLEEAYLRLMEELEDEEGN
ncbi:MAG: ABC transporter ATP-binding protein [Sulfolobales archaeon]|nr:ABC transporter ATP-binding protein [Sulfolobales archaeon]